MVRADLVLPQPFAEGMGDALYLPSGVHEHECRPVLADELRDAIAHFLALFLRGHRGQLLPRDLHPEVVRALASHVDDGASRPPAGFYALRTDEKARDLLDWPLRSGKSDAHRAVPAQRLQPLQR